MPNQLECGTYKSTNNHAGKSQRPAASTRGKVMWKTPVSLALLLQRGITAGKTQSGLHKQQQWQYRTVSENQHRCCDLEL